MAAAPQKGRKSPRLQISLTARYRSPTAFEFVKEECFDLSAGGMFIKSPAPAPAGTLIKLECDVDRGAHTIRGVARVVWLRELDAEGQPAGMGVKFVKLEAGGREAIQAVLQQLGPTAGEVAENGARRSEAPVDGSAEPFPRTPSASPRPDASPTRAPEPSSAPSPVAHAAPQTSADPEDQRETERPPGPPASAKRSDPRELRQRLHHAKRSEKRVAPGQDAPTPVEMPVPHEVAAAIARASGQVSARVAAEEQSSSAAKPQSRPEPTAPPIPSAPEATPAAKPAQSVSSPSKPARDLLDAPRSPPSTRPLLYGVATALAAAALYAGFSGRKPAPHRAPRVEPPPAAAVAAPEPPRAQEAPAQVQPAPAVNDEPAPPATQAAPALEPRYVLEVATTPEGARVAAGKQTLVAPGNLELGTLEEPVQLEATKSGFQSASAIVDRVGFMLEDGAMRRRIVLTLVEEPKPPPPVAQKPPKQTPEPAPKVARAKPVKEQPAVAEAKPEPAAKTEPKAAPLVVAAAPVEARPPPKPEPTATEAPKPAVKQTPMQVATECLGTGDNACVVKALEGKAKSAQELELLIETYRAMGSADQAEKQMRLYVEKYPTERHATGYRRVLERRQGEAPSPP